MLRDETGAFAQRLREAGVPATDAVIASATGWPCSLMCPEERGRDVLAPWADEVARTSAPVLRSAAGGRRLTQALRRAS